MKGLAIAITTLLTLIFVSMFLIMAIPSTRSWVNEYVFEIERIDEEQDYQNRKNVEDTARAMITNYNSYKMEYNTYKVFEQGTSEYLRALNAKTAGNNVASAYNNYITENSFIFEGNLPDDIPAVLPYIE